MISNQKPKVMIEVSEEWSRLVLLVERAKWGRCEILFKDGIPTDVKPLIPHVKLDDETAFDEGFRAVGL